MKNKGVYLLLALLCLLTACNNTDDVQKIFTGKTWKLSVIKYAGSDKECKDYWVDGQGKFNQSAFEISNKWLMEAGNFTLTFTGATIDDEISGKASVKAIAVNINDASWRANAKSNEFAIGIKNTADKDVLATAFLKGLAKATSYSGNEHNLYLYFTEGQQSKYMVFHINR